MLMYGLILVCVGNGQDIDKKVDMVNRVHIVLVPDIHMLLHSF
jgi:hypothetical protein